MNQKRKSENREANYEVFETKAVAGFWNSGMLARTFFARPIPKE
jgi:hypothetical protein